MILIFNNRGILIPVFLIVPFFGITILYSFLKENVGGFFATDAAFQIALGIGLIISFLWTYLTSYDFIKVNGEKEKIEMNNYFFYMSNRLWSYIMLGAGILTIIGGIMEFFYG
ncbi:hypothetical protein IMCC3317_00330 [Kordia antarctica]|uniref:Uncharacterized protein n=1 Tax=Kordia antarctica TaxID=1218801 RepID=A0A7L4ZDN5_9FLAO|nr:hypothetical protein [Kordia antarctica]QHI34690.1 hypothetical protein IMCC3317_00330 [Kordia antarctica]